jgi:hypothetical protein
MRELKDHIVEGDLPQNQLKIQVTDEPGAGGASHRYEISGIEHYNPSETIEEKRLAPRNCIILFQQGPIKEAGINGITQEALLAIVIDRLRSFQAGPFPSEENDMALQNCMSALYWLKERTKKRLARGIEGQTKA